MSFRDLSEIDLDKTPAFTRHSVASEKILPLGRAMINSFS